MAAAPVLVLLSSILALAVFFPLTYLLARALRVRPNLIVVPDPKRAVNRALLIVLVSFAWVFVWRILTHTLQLDTCSHIFSVVPTCSSVVVDVLDVPWLLAGQGPILLTIFLFMRRANENRGAVGIVRQGWRKMVAIGATISAVFLTIGGLFAPSIGGGFAGFSTTLAYLLGFYAISAFGEETIWRGYVQTRLSAYSGRVVGLGLTAVLFAVLWHLPSEYYAQSGDILVALGSTLTRVAPGLLFGFLMLRTQNVIPSSVFHIFWNWSIFLWQLSTA